MGPIVGEDGQPLYLILSARPITGVKTSPAASAPKTAEVSAIGAKKKMARGVRIFMGKISAG
jgi:hypothetical protein